MVEVFNPTSIVTSAYGLAFDLDGNLYVSSWRAAPNGGVVKLNASGVMVDQITGLDKPRGIAFDYLGNLFVAEEGGRILKLTAPAMTAETWGIVPAPMGIAVDSAGDLFVTSNTNNVVYRITRFRAMSVFAMLNRPGGITVDDRGFFYVSDTVKNLISRISPLGDTKIYAYGISDPRGLAVDPGSGTVYVSLSQSNAILKVEGGALKPFVTGIANPMTINFRGNGLLIAHPETHTISFARRNGQLSTLATGLEFPGGADQAVDGGGNLMGPLYVPRFGDTESADARRLPRYDIRSLTYGGYHGLDVIDNGVKTLRRWLYRHNSPSSSPTTFVAIDGSGNMYILDTLDRTLTRVAAAPGGGNSARAIQRLCGERSPYEFSSVPAWVAVDQAENVYVSVPDENKIYRFTKASGYVKQEITGFNAPWGIAFSDTAPQAMFVSNPGDGVIRRVSNPVTATIPDAGFSIPADTTVKGLAYMASGTLGTGTLYMANGGSVKKADITGNNYVGATYADYVTGLPVSWSYLYARSSTQELFGYGNATFAHKISAPPEKTVVEFINLTGDSVLDGFAFDAGFSTYRWTRRFGIGSLSTLITTREVELSGNLLYVASPDTYSGHGNFPGGILRINLGTQQELFIPLRTYSLGVESVSGHLYAGASDGRIYRVEASGLHSQIWNLGTVPYGLDVRGTTVWAVGADGRIFEQVIGNATIKGHKYGLKEPSF
ncbi:Serine/threonine-protein kinase PknD [compost metagenome]